MLTIRFESLEAGIVWLTEATSCRVVRHQDGTADVMLPNAVGVEIAHPLCPSAGGYDSAFVMNANGKTIASFRSACVPEPGVQQAA